MRVRRAVKRAATLGQAGFAIGLRPQTSSLTPGTVSSDVSADGRFLLVHALDVADAAAEIARIKTRYEAPLLRIFP